MIFQEKKQNKNKNIPYTPVNKEEMKMKMEGSYGRMVQKTKCERHVWKTPRSRKTRMNELEQNKRKKGRDERNEK